MAIRGTEFTLYGQEFALSAFDARGVYEPLTVDSQQYDRWTGLFVASALDYAQPKKSDIGTALFFGLTQLQTTLNTPVNLQVGAYVVGAKSSDPLNNYFYARITSIDPITGEIDLHIFKFVGSASGFVPATISMTPKRSPNYHWFEGVIAVGGGASLNGQPIGLMPFDGIIDYMQAYVSAGSRSVGLDNITGTLASISSVGASVSSKQILSRNAKFTKGTTIRLDVSSNATPASVGYSFRAVPDIEVHPLI